MATSILLPGTDPTVPEHGPREKSENEIGHETAKKWSYGGFYRLESKVSI